MQLSKAIRSKLDGLREGVRANCVAQAEIAADPVGYLAAQGIVTNSGMGASAGSSEFHTGVVHMCPWHTCANTKHAIEEPRMAADSL